MVSSLAYGKGRRSPVYSPDRSRSTAIPCVTLHFMLIGIDATRANKPEKTGVEWYAWHLIQEMKKLTVNDGNSWVLYTREPLRGELSALPENWYEVRAGWPPRRLWTQVRLSWEMWRRPVDVLFVPAHVLPSIRPEKSVVTVHDVGFRRHPRLYQRADIEYHEASTRHLAKTDARIITVSEFSGKELVELYHVDPKRIAIIPNGIDHERYKPATDRSAIDAVLTRLQIPTPYFLTVGRLEAKKNIVNIVKAFNAFKVHRGLGDPTRLVFAGKPGYQYSVIKKAIEASPYRDQIIELGYTDENDLPSLFSGAVGLIHLSWYEGFGIPPVQAMACGCPVIASSVASLPEIIGAENGLFVSPAEPDQAARAMDRLLNEPALRQSLSSKGMQRAAIYTWKSAAEKTIPVLTQWVV